MSRMRFPPSRNLGGVGSSRCPSAVRPEEAHWQTISATQRNAVHSVNQPQIYRQTYCVQAYGSVVRHYILSCLTRR
jgi:hypothetical protein